MDELISMVEEKRASQWPDDLENNYATYHGIRKKISKSKIKRTCNLTAWKAIAIAKNV